MVTARLAAQHLDRRLPASARGRAARYGLQDGSPRSAVLSLYARAAGTTADAWEDPAFVQVWGPRGAVWVVPAADVAVFTLGLLPRDEALREAAEQDADLLAAALGADRVRKRAALDAVGGRVDRLLRAAPTGRLRIRWDGRDTLVWAVSAAVRRPRRGARRAAASLPGRARARDRHRLRDLGGPDAGRRAGDLGGGGRRAGPDPAPHDAPARGVRLLPPGDLFLQAPDRDLLVPDAARRAAVWPRGTPQPGALLVDGELAGTWRRRGDRLEVAAFDHPSEETRRAAEEEAAGFPLDLARPVEVRWTGP